MSTPVVLTAQNEDVGVRADQFIQKYLPEYDEIPPFSRSAIQKLIESGSISMLRENIISPLTKHEKMRLNDVISLTLPQAVESEILPQDIPLDIVYEDEHMMIVNKQRGMVVHPAPGNYDQTLVNALLYHCKDSLSGINGVKRPGILHRIDKDTSGLLAVAKNDAAHIKLAAQIQSHSFKREYEAILHGYVKQDEGVIETYIARNRLDRKRMAISNEGKLAITHYSVIGYYKFNTAPYTHTRFILQTGRTHQIRVHAQQYMHNPVAGDPAYGNGKDPLSLCGQALHAKYIGFFHPISGEFMEFDSALPEYFTAAIERMTPFN